MRQLDPSERELLTRIVADAPLRLGPADRRRAARLEDMGLARTIAPRSHSEARFVVASGAGMQLAETFCHVDAFTRRGRGEPPQPGALVA